MAVDLLIRDALPSVLNTQFKQTEIQSFLEELLQELNCAKDLSVLLTNDHEIQELNASYRGKDQPTDVLSFALAEGEAMQGTEDLLGDIVVSLETAQRQAVEQSVTLREELARLLIHGVLHLLGYDHENVSSQEAQRMQDKEQELFTLLIGPC